MVTYSFKLSLKIVAKPLQVKTWLLLTAQPIVRYDLSMSSKVNDLYVI